MPFPNNPGEGPLIGSEPSAGSNAISELIAGLQGGELARRGLEALSYVNEFPWDERVAAYSMLPKQYQAAHDIAVMVAELDSGPNRSADSRKESIKAAKNAIENYNQLYAKKEAS